MNTLGVTKSKDGVPQWDGDSSTFQEYEEQCMQWEQSIVYHKRYLCGPRLVGELSGPAKKHVMGKRPDWLSYSGGVGHLMQHLRSCLGRPTIPEMTDYLNRYFRASKRKRYETMNHYITRKVEIYHRARQALSRVQRYYQHRAPRDWSRNTWSWDQRDWSQRGWGADGQWNYNNEGEHNMGDDETEEDATNGNDGTDPDEDSSQHQSGPGWTDHWSTYSQWNTSSYAHPEDEPWKLHTEELLPEFLQGWYLLQDAGLESAEKNLVQTAIQEDFSVERVSRELRFQWPDHELKQRDQNAKYTSFWNDEIYHMDDDMEMLSSNKEAWHVQDMNEEGQILYGEAEEEAQRAFALIQQGKRILRDARARQHQMRLNRQYYKPTFQKTVVNQSSSSTGGNSQVSANLCLRCGKGHRTAECPDKHAPRDERPRANVVEEAPFVCFTEETALAVTDSKNGKTTLEAMTSGLGVIDGGATKTLGSVEAIQAVMDLNKQKYGTERIAKIDVNNKPTFGFGNSTTDTCVSTTQLQVSADNKPGILEIHALDRGQGPILISINTLRKLKATIDFEHDLMVLRGLDARKVIRLERSVTGHQLLPLTEDLFKHARTCQTPVPSLHDHV